MEECIDLYRLVFEVFEALTCEDCSALNSLLSKDEHVLMIGTDPNEWWSGHDTIYRMVTAQASEMRNIKVINVDTKCYCEGAVGWAASRVILKMPDGRNVPFRATGLFRQEHGIWKLMQWHNSIGITNEEAIGLNLTTRVN
jgi:hypothetical protein